MTEPIAAVARVAATPEQAKIFVAMLQAEGIPAQIEGDSLADEVAVSRRLMNLGGTRVLVPTASLQRAKEILDVGDIDADELTAQAMAAEQGEVPPPSREATAPPRTPWLLIGTMVAAAMFLALWLNEVNDRTSFDGPMRFEEIPGGFRHIRAADGFVLAEYMDNAITQFADDGTRIESRDDDGDLRFESLVELRGAWSYRWLDNNGDGLFDVCEVTDASGKKVQELRYVPGTGFTVQQY